MKLLPAVPADRADQLSWWQKDVGAVPPLPRNPALDDGQHVDVAIVGGGFTGLWTALILKERAPHLNVAIFEAYSCGDGASSRNGGNVHGYWSAMPTLLPLFGADKAIEIAKLASLAQDRLRKFAANKSRDVWWVEKGYLRVATNPLQLVKLQEFVSVAHELGIESTVRNLSKHQLGSLCNSPRYLEGLHFQEGATVHPARLVLALRDAVLAAGVHVWEHTPVDAVVHGTPCQVSTLHGMVTANEVVLATYTGTTALPPVARGTTLFSSFPVMSHQNPELLEKMNYADARGIADLRMFTHYFRRTRDGRVLMGSGSGPLEFEGRHDSERLRHDPESVARATSALTRFFPGMNAQNLTSWGFPIEVSSDRIPFFGTIAGTRIHYGSGYSGHGVNATAIAGECITSLILKQTDKWSTSPFCRGNRISFPPEPFRYVGGRVVRRAIVECEDAEDAGRSKPLIWNVISRVPSLMGMRIGTR